MASDMVRELIAAARCVLEHDLPRLDAMYPTHIRVIRRAKRLRDAIATLEAAEVPAKPEMCLWMPSEFSHYCGDWTAWEAQLPDDGKCPDCGRKIEEGNV